MKRRRANISPPPLFWRFQDTPKGSVRLHCPPVGGYPAQQKHTPHSLQRRMGGLHVDRIFQTVYLLDTSDLPLGCRECWEIGKLWDILQSIKHRYTQIFALEFSKTVCLVLLSVVSVFRLWGSSGVRTYAENALDPERRWNFGISWTYLAHGTHSFPVSILYNIFLNLSIALCNFNIFTKFSSAQKCNLHKQPFTSLFDVPGLKAKKGEIIGLSENRHAPGAARAGLGAESTRGGFS